MVSLASVFVVVSTDAFIPVPVFHYKSRTCTSKFHSHCRVMLIMVVMVVVGTHLAVSSHHRITKDMREKVFNNVYHYITTDEQSSTRDRIQVNAHTAESRSF